MVCATMDCGGIIYKDFISLLDPQSNIIFNLQKYKEPEDIVQKLSTPTRKQDPEQESDKKIDVCAHTHGGEEVGRDGGRQAETQRRETKKIWQPTT